MLENPFGETNWEKVVEEPDIKQTRAYKQGAEDAFKKVINYIPKRIYDKLYADFFRESRNDGMS